MWRANRAPYNDDIISVGSGLKCRNRSESLQSSLITQVTQSKVTDSFTGITHTPVKHQQGQRFWKECYCKDPCKIPRLCWHNWRKTRQTQTSNKGLEASDKRTRRLHFSTWSIFSAEKKRILNKSLVKMKRETIITSLHSLANKEGRVMFVQMWNRKCSLSKTEKDQNFIFNL